MELNESIKQATLSFRHKINHNIRITCPECSHRRKGSNKREPVMAVLIKEDRLIYDCKHCGVNGCAPLKNTTPPRIRLKPDEKKRAEEGVLTPLSMEYLTSNRKISKQVLKDHGIYSTQVFFPKLEKKVEAIGFPYLQDGEVYATKFRAVEAKAHTQNGGGANTLFGEHLINGETTLTICEGEVDSLSLWSAGVASVSVPNGAPQKISENRVDPSEDKKFSYVWNARELFARMERIVLAVDGDQSGTALAEELARRIGKAKCFLVQWPNDCKDANDMLVNHGGEALKDLIENAKPYPLSGLHNAEYYNEAVDILYSNGVAKGESTGFDGVDEIYTVKTGYVTVVTGIPSSGKSCFLDHVMVNLAKNKEWKFAICSFENDPATHITQLIEKFTLKPFFEGPTPRLTAEELKESKAFVDDHFVFIDNNEGEKASLSSVLDRATGAVQRMGVRGLVIDPFSYLSLPDKSKSETQQISDMLTDVRMFAKLHDIHVWFVAHPAKMRREEGTTPIPKGYDLSGSAHWFNFADAGLTVARFIDKTCDEERVKIICWKMRYRWLGKQGETVLDFDLPSGSYYEKKKTIEPIKHWSDSTPDF